MTVVPKNAKNAKNTKNAKNCHSMPGDGLRLGQIKMPQKTQKNPPKCVFVCVSLGPFGPLFWPFYGKEKFMK